MKNKPEPKKEPPKEPKGLPYKILKRIRRKKAGA
jgi:hypothetical protein